MMKAMMMSNQHLTYFNNEFRILKLIGNDAMAMTYLIKWEKQRAQSKSTGNFSKYGRNQCASVKIFKPEFLRADQAARHLFLNEISILSKIKADVLKYPGIVHMVSYGIEGTMQFQQQQATEAEVLTEKSRNNVWFIVKERS